MRRSRALFAAVVSVAAFAAAGAIGACTSSDGDPATTTPGTDSGPTVRLDAAPGRDAATSPACVTHPQTYLDIINACTDAQAVDKQDDLSVMNLPDGALRPLP